MILELQRESRTPLYLQIAAQVREMISRGTLSEGDRLPANREMARILGVNRTTVTTAYQELEADGLISSHVGRGTFVTAASKMIKPVAPRVDSSPAPLFWSTLFADQKQDLWLNGLLDSHQRRDTISLAHGLPPADLFPLDDFRRCVDRVLRKEGRVLLQLGFSSGYVPLQEYISSQMALSGIRAGADEILITNGCQQSLDLIRRVFVEAGDEVAIENPTYPGAISVFCNEGVRHISIPVGGDGIDLNALEDILSQRRPKLIYTIPTYHNPTGISMSMQSRRRLLELAARHRVPIIEDDIYRELHYDGALLPSLKALDRHGLVIYINSFSKVGFPGLRVGWVAAPKVVIERLNLAKQKSDLHASLLTQASIYEFSRHGLLAKHVKRVRRAYVQRRDAMIASLEKHFPAEATWQRPEGGMAIWVRLPQSINAQEILILALESGVSFSPGQHFYAGVPEQNLMRLCFTIAGPAVIEEGIKRLGSVIKARLSSLKKSRTTTRAEASRALV